MTELSRIVALDRIGQTGLDYVVEATPAECTAVALRLKIPEVTRLRCTFKLRRHTGSVIEAEGRLEGAVVQTCVVSLDPCPQTVTDMFSVQFVPRGTEAPDDDFEAPDQIVYEGSAIDLGEAATEQLSLALDPYPRKPGLDATPEDAEDSPNPFAGLAALRNKQ